jgi:hypothetical protein
MPKNRCPRCGQTPFVDACSSCGAGARELWSRQKVTVRSLKEFVKAVKPMSPDSGSRASGHYWYRGQTNAEWGLETSFLRMTQHLAKRTDQAILLEDAARQEFMSKAHLFVDPGHLAKVKTIPCWWALMQHHGAPTRLLDWSASPYVAAYFAAHQDGSESDGAVWGFCHRRLHHRFVAEYGTQPPDLTKTENQDRKVQRLHDALRDPRAKPSVLPLEFKFFSSARMAEQQGRFTMCLRVHQDHACIATKIQATHLKKIIIPHKTKPHFLAELRRMNITAAALFPGVDGLGRSIAELTSLGARHAAAAREA